MILKVTSKSVRVKSVCSITPIPHHLLLWVYSLYDVVSSISFPLNFLELFYEE